MGIDALMAMAFEPVVVPLESTRQTLGLYRVLSSDVVSGDLFCRTWLPRKFWFHHLLVGGWNNPSENMLVKLEIFPNFRVKIKNWNHHLVFYHLCNPCQQAPFGDFSGIFQALETDWMKGGPASWCFKRVEPFIWTWESVPKGLGWNIENVWNQHRKNHLWARLMWWNSCKNTLASWKLRANNEFSCFKVGYSILPW